MKSVFRAVTFVLFCCLMSLSAAAAVFEDYMDDFTNQSNIKYEYLVKNTDDALASMADKTALSCPDSLASGWVVYQVRGAEKITLELYSHQGTFVTHDPDLEEFGFGLGQIYGEIAGRSLTRAMYNPATRAVYMRYYGDLYRAHYHEFGYTYFLKTSEPTGDLINYGATVSWYAPGYSWTPLELTNEPVAKVPGNGYYNEILTAKIPPGVTMVRVDVSGVGKFPYVDSFGIGNLPPVFPEHSNALASVKLEGAALDMRPPAPIATRPPPIVWPEEPEDEPTEEPRRSSSRASSSRASSSRASSSSKASGSPSSKFTGVVEPAGPSGPKFTGAIADPSAKEKQTEPPREGREPEREQGPPEQSLEQAATAPLTYEQPSAVVYQVEGGAAGSRENSASAWIMGYSVLLTGAILAVLLKSRRK